MLEQVPETIDFAKEEEKILEFWTKNDVFRNSLKQSKGKPRYSFYDGPPFATGLPHYGHILAGTIKDVVTRFAHQSGFHVERRFGWDCHGLPVEFEIDKTHGIKGPEDVEKMGIENYNLECRKIVTRYATQWEEIVTRLGRWIDFKNDYKTLYPWFMESIWWVFSQLYSKGLVYRGVKVMPYSTACNTPLSNFESGQNYKEVIDPAVTVSFQLIDKPDISFLSWTTTPWTLPSNLALCVNASKTYVKIKDSDSGKIYILMEARLPALYKSEDQYVVLEKMEGIKLKGIRYKPLFPYFAHLAEKGAFQVVTDGYVTEESGTGIVHQAPYFGEDDYRVLLAAGIITRDQEMVCPVDESGRFTQPVVDFLGQYVKDADKNIIKWLKEAGSLVVNATVKHSYPYCWRSDTPLIYKAVPSWFVRVEQMAQDLLQCNQETYWVPDFVKEKRFGNWLRDARDWAISRNRYWGTPIPLWKSDDDEEYVCVGSIPELEKLTGKKISDIHRESVDHLTIPSARPGHPPLRRVNEVFDCWFESGSMPYAQVHYPFEKKKEFLENFPADFIAEGIDQTRGWFYTLLVISTALFKKPPFKNLIVNGLVLASDGQKMSKRKKNYPDPLEVVQKFGADALRLYLINSPVVRAENLRFKEEGVRDILKDVFLPWYNAYRFLVQNVYKMTQETGKQFQFNEISVKNCSDNIMDQWILSFTQSLLKFVKSEMAAYRLYTVVPHLVKFIDNLTNWYVRMNRKRLKGDGGLNDCQKALSTLFSVLYSMVRIMAPFTPFLTELMYQNLHKVVSFTESKDSIASVHYLMLPEVRLSLIDKKIENSVARMQTVIDLGRVARDRKTIPVKYPLPGIIVIHEDSTVLKDLQSFEKYILEELNVRTLTVTTDKTKYGVKLRAEPDHKILGARLKSAFKPITQAIKALSDEELQNFLQKGEMELLGHRIEPNDLRIMYTFTGDSAEELASRYEAHSENDVLILLDITPDQDMQDEGLAREVVNRVQKLRKKAHLLPTDSMTAYYSVLTKGSVLERITSSYSSFIENSLKVPFRQLHDGVGVKVIEETVQLKGSELKLVITKGFCKDWVNISGASCVSTAEPFCCFVNIQLLDIQPLCFITSNVGTLLLENPSGDNSLSVNQLRDEISSLFCLQGKDFDIYLSGSTLTKVEKLKSIQELNKQTLLICSKDFKDLNKFSNNSQEVPTVKFINVQYNGLKCTVLLENPSNRFQTDITKVKQLIGKLFNLDPVKVNILKDSCPMQDISSLSTGETLSVVTR